MPVTVWVLREKYKTDQVPGLRVFILVGGEAGEQGSPGPFSWSNAGWVVCLGRFLPLRTPFPMGETQLRGI